MQQRIVTNLWFDTQAEEAAQFYCSVFPNSRVVSVARYPEGAPGPAGEVMTVEWELDGQRLVGINGGPQFTFSEAVSLAVMCRDQDEIDHYWERLSDGGEEGPCGWLKDRYGVSWQVVPEGMDDVFSDPDPSRAQRAMQAMLGMRKIDLAALQAAADGVPAA
jgi:predicted 3-demethylubiquinone-9 3-methyltransferase (glyoxalase superfamily)